MAHRNPNESYIPNRILGSSTGKKNYQPALPPRVIVWDAPKPPRVLKSMVHCMDLGPSMDTPICPNCVLENHQDVLNFVENVDVC